MKRDPYSDNPFKPRSPFVTVLYKWLKTLKPICEVIVILYAGVLFVAKKYPSAVRGFLGMEETAPAKINVNEPPNPSTKAPPERLEPQSPTFPQPIPSTSVSTGQETAPSPPNKPVLPEGFLTETSTPSPQVPHNPNLKPTESKPDQPTTVSSTTSSSSAGRRPIPDPSSPAPPKKTPTTADPKPATSKTTPVAEEHRAWVEQVAVKITLDREHTANRLVLALQMGGRTLAEISQVVDSEAKYLLPLKKHLSPDELNRCYLTVRRDMLPGPKDLIGGITGLGDWKVTINAKAEGYWAPAAKTLKGATTRSNFTGAWGDKTTVRVSALGDPAIVKLSDPQSLP